MQSSQDKKAISEQASWWLDSPAHDPRRAAFGEWVRRSPEHMAEFVTMAAVRSLVREVQPNREERLSRMIADSGAPANVATAGDVAGGRPRRPSWSARIQRAIAATVLMFSMAAGFFLHYEFRWTEYSTVDSGPRTVHLGDGSTMYLSSRSRVEVRFSGSLRLARLYDGEAMFKVAHRRDSSFRVEVSGVTIDALKAQFGVSRQGDATAVSVIEGTARITGSTRKGRTHVSVALMAGQSARIGFDGRISSGMDSTAAGAGEPLVFHRRPLQHVADEFNSHNPVPQFVVEPGAKALAFSAILGPKDTDSLTQILEHRPDVEVIRDGNIIRIRPRSHSETGGAGGSGTN
jgi:transmembrane sensor